MPRVRVGVVVLAVLLAAPVLAARRVAGPVTMSLTSVPLTQAVVIFSRHTGLEVLYDQADGGREVTVGISAQPAEQALAQLAAAAGLQVLALADGGFLLVDAARLTTGSPTAGPIGALVAPEGPVERFAIEAWLLRLTPEEAVALEIPSRPAGNLNLDAVLAAAERTGVARRYRFSRQVVDMGQIWRGLIRVNDTLPDGTRAPLSAALVVRPKVATGARQRIWFEVAASVRSLNNLPAGNIGRQTKTAFPLMPAGQALILDMYETENTSFDDSGLCTLLLVRAVPEPVD